MAYGIRGVAEWVTWRGKCVCVIEIGLCVRISAGIEKRIKSHEREHDVFLSYKLNQKFASVGMLEGLTGGVVAVDVGVTDEDAGGRHW